MWRWPHVVYKGWVHFFYQILQTLATWRCGVPLPSIKRNYQKETPHWCLCTRRRGKILANWSLFLWLSKMLIQLWPVELKCQKMRNILPTQYHATLGSPVNHIVPISKPKHAIFNIVCLRLIVDVCIYIPYLLVYKSTFYDQKISPKNRPRLIHESYTKTWPSSPRN